MGCLYPWHGAPRGGIGATGRRKPETTVDAARTHSDSIRTCGRPGGARAPSTLVNRNVTIGRRRTSLRLEPAMWDALEGDLPARGDEPARTLRDDQRAAAAPSSLTAGDPRVHRQLLPGGGDRGGPRQHRPRRALQDPGPDRRAARATRPPSGATNRSRCRTWASVSGPPRRRWRRRGQLSMIAGLPRPRWALFFLASAG